MFRILETCSSQRSTDSLSHAVSLPVPHPTRPPPATGHHHQPTGRQQILPPSRERLPVSAFKGLRTSVAVTVAQTWSGRMIRAGQMIRALSTFKRGTRHWA